MSPRGYITFETVKDPINGIDLMRDPFLDPVFRAHPPEECVLFLQVQLHGNPVHDLRFDVECRNYPCDDKPQGRLGKVYPWAMPRCH